MKKLIGICYKLLKKRTVWKLNDIEGYMCGRNISVSNNWK